MTGLPSWVTAFLGFAWDKRKILHFAAKEELLDAAKAVELAQNLVKRAAILAKAR